MINDLRTVPAALDRLVRQLPDHTALIAEDRRFTSTELRDAVYGAAAALIALGVEPADRVAIWSPNTWHWVVACLAIHHAGAAVVPLNTRYTATEATAATLGKAPSELVGEPTFPAVATEAAGSAGASDAAIATGAAGPAVTDQSRTVAGPTVLTGGTRPTVPAIAIQQSTRPTGLARPAVSAVADQRPANNAWVGALTALSTSCANVALAVSAAAYHPPPEVRAATNCARYAAACALICWYSCAFAPNSAAIAIDTSSAAVGRQRRRRACHERIGRADRRTDPRHICGGRGQKEGCAITNDM